MVLTRFSPIRGAKLAHLRRPSAFRGAQIAQYGLKMGLLHLFATPNIRKVYSEKHIFHPFLTDFWSLNNPFSRHFVTPEWPKWLAMGLKSPHFTCFCTVAGLGSFLEKLIFDTFSSQNKLFSRKLVTLGWPKWLAMGSKRVHSTCLGTPNDLRSLFRKYIRR